jgi:large subunit ribosomal protein L10
VKAKKQKHEEVDYLRKELSETTNLVVVKFQGLTVGQDTELRQKIREADSKYRVVKNTLVKIACEGTPAAELADAFDGSTAIAYNASDPVALAKALSEYAKANPVFEFKAGMVESRVVDIARLAEIAALPSHEGLISQLMYLINAPAQRTAIAVNAVVRNLAVVLGQAVEEKKFSE